MKEDNPITDAIRGDVTNTEDNAKGEQTTGETAAAAEAYGCCSRACSRQTDSANKDSRPHQKRSGMMREGAPSLRTIIRQQAIEDELPLTKNVTLGKILGGEMLNTQFLRQQIWVIVLITLFIIVYISNRYKCQQNLIKINNLTERTGGRKVQRTLKLERPHAADSREQGARTPAQRQGQHAAHTYAATVYHNHS